MVWEDQPTTVIASGKFLTWGQKILFLESAFFFWFLLFVQVLYSGLNIWGNIRSRVLTMATTTVNLVAPCPCCGWCQSSWIQQILDGFLAILDLSFNVKLFSFAIWFLANVSFHAAAAALCLLVWSSYTLSTFFLMFTQSLKEKISRLCNVTPIFSLSVPILHGPALFISLPNSSTLFCSPYFLFV